MSPRTGQPCALRPNRRGKIREIFDLGEQPSLVENGENPWEGQMAIVTTDKISAFDHVLPDLIPHKGQDLNLITAWFKFHEDIQAVGKNDLITINNWRMPAAFHSDDFDGRTALVHKTQPIPVECIVRGNHIGSGYRYYEEHQDGTVYGQWIGQGFKEGNFYPHPLFTPSTKADEGEHDENIMLQDLPEVLYNSGIENPDENAIELEYLSTRYFTVARNIFAEKGLLLADCKLEFGWHPEWGIILIDECFTPDCARILDLVAYEHGELKSGLDKDRVRRKLKEMGWNGENSNPPHLPADTIADTTRVCDLNLRTITGRSYDEFAALRFNLEPGH